jgi:hypothetical protein
MILFATARHDRVLRFSVAWTKAIFFYDTDDSIGLGGKQGIMKVQKGTAMFAGVSAPEALKRAITERITIYNHKSYTP